MLTLADIIRSPKDSVTIPATWRNGKVPASAFPIARQRTFPASSAWSWRVVEFKALARDFRLLIGVNIETSYYSSILAMVDGAKSQIVCHHERHLSHRNWHCHFVRGNVDETYPGVLRDVNKMRIYEAEPSKAREVPFEVTLDDALAVAAKRFRFSAPNEAPRQGSLL